NNGRGEVGKQRGNCPSTRLNRISVSFALSVLARLSGHYNRVFSSKAAGGQMVLRKTQIMITIGFLGVMGASWFTGAQKNTSDHLVHPPLRVLTKSQTLPDTFITPDQIKIAYGFNQVANRGLGQTIGVVVAFDDDRIEEDLAQFSTTFGLPPCPSSNGCFRKVFATPKNPGTKSMWTIETALDVEWAHAIAPEAKLLLVESPSDHLDDMLAAVDVAVRNGATVVSMSWGGAEFAEEVSNDTRFMAPGSDVIFVAASGNS